MATLKILKQGNVYKELEKKASLLFSGLEAVARDAGVEVTVNRVGSMGSLFFGVEPVVDFATAKKCRQYMFIKYYESMLGQGIYLAPSPFEAMFLSTAHSEEIIKKTGEFAAIAFRTLDKK